MRVLLVTTWFPSIAAPVSGSFVAKDARLLAEQHDVHVVHLGSPSLLSADDPEADLNRPYRVTRIPMSTSSPVAIARAGRQLKALLTEADVLHTQAFSALLPFATLRVGVPWVHTEHWGVISSPPGTGVMRFALPPLLRLLRRPDIVTAVCDYLAQPIRRVRSGPTRVVPCIVASPDVVESRPARSQPALVSVGALNAHKGPLLAVAAVQLLRERGVDVTLRWIGDGPQSAEAAEAASEAGLSGIVQFVGSKPPVEVFEELARADLFLLPTLSENFCVSAAEAIVHGCPVVVGATGGQGEYITPINGFLVEERTPEAYADAVQRMLGRNPKPTAQEIAATIGDSFSPQTVLQAYTVAYEDASRAHASQPSTS